METVTIIFVPITTVPTLYDNNMCAILFILQRTSILLTHRL